MALYVKLYNRATAWVFNIEKLQNCCRGDSAALPFACMHTWLLWSFVYSTATGCYTHVVKNHSYFTAKQFCYRYSDNFLPQLNTMHCNLISLCCGLPMQIDILSTVTDHITDAVEYERSLISFTEQHEADLKILMWKLLTDQMYLISQSDVSLIQNLSKCSQALSSAWWVWVKAIKCH